MKKLISFLLALTLLTGNALAQSAVDTRLSLGAWDAALQEAPAAETVDPYTGMTAWQLDDAEDEAGVRTLLHTAWLPQRGMAADVLVDFDRDESMEWVVLSTRGGSDDDSLTTLWASVYELEEGEARLTAEACLFAAPIDLYGECIEVFFLEKGESVMMFAAGGFAVDSRWQQNWLLSYYGERLWVEGGYFLSQDETGAQQLSVVGKASPFVLTKWDPWELPASAETFTFAADEADLFAARLRITADSLGVNVETDESGLYDHFPVESEELLLLEIDCFAEAADGAPVIRIERMLLEGSEPAFTGESVPAFTTVTPTGTINLRDKPFLTGTILEIIQPGTALEYLQEDSVDERGVVWYKVRSAKNEGWASSKYTVLE